MSGTTTWAYSIGGEANLGSSDAFVTGNFVVTATATARAGVYAATAISGTFDGLPIVGLSEGTVDNFRIPDNLLSLDSGFLDGLDGYGLGFEINGGHVVDIANATPNLLVGFELSGPSQTISGGVTLTSLPNEPDFVASAVSFNTTAPPPQPPVVTLAVAPVSGGNPITIGTAAPGQGTDSLAVKLISDADLRAFKIVGC